MVVKFNTITEDEAVVIITSYGWYKLKRGWYHPNAWTYIGWVDEPRCHATALDVITNEFEGMDPLKAKSKGY